MAPPLPGPLPRLVVLHPNEGSLTIARVLARRGVTVHFLAAEAFAHALRSRAVTGTVLPDPRIAPERWIAELHGLAGDGGVLLSGSDAATTWLVQHRGDVPASLRSFESADGAHLRLMDKRRLYEAAAEAGVRTPWMHHVRTHEELDELDITFPCILKATQGHVARSLVGFGTTRIDSPAELRDRAGALLEHGLEIVLSELVPGPETALEGSVLVRDASGRVDLRYGRRKVRQWPVDYGVGSLLESADVPEVHTEHLRLLEHTGFVGIASCEMKRHSGNGRLYLIEVNVRIPGNFGLSQACGVDGPWRLYAALAGLPLAPQPRQVDGRRVLLPEEDLRSVLFRLRHGLVTVPEVARSVRGVRDVGTLSVRDPRPGLALVGGMAGRRGRSLAGRLLHRAAAPHSTVPPAAPAPGGAVGPATPIGQGAEKSLRVVERS
jgi:predicted ATP-grasp superfamily ATP-dependent carboligase